MTKLTDEKIIVSTTDLEAFLRLLSAYGDKIGNPYIVDASQTILDQILDTDQQFLADFEAWSEGQIKFR